MRSLRQFILVEGIGDSLIGFLGILATLLFIGAYIDKLNWVWLVPAVLGAILFAISSREIHGLGKKYQEWYEDYVYHHNLHEALKKWRERRKEDD